MARFFHEFDGGNGACKLGNGNTTKLFVHALRAMDVSERERKTRFAGAQGLHPDYIEVFEGTKSKSSVLYSTGATALNDGFREFRVGAERYKAGYYDVLALRSLTMLLKDASFEKPNNDNEVVMTVTHAPQDSGFAQKMVDCLMGWHKVQNAGRILYYNIVHVETLDEPVAGLLNYTLDQDGKPKPKAELWTSPGRVLVLDIGQYTANWQEADQNGVPANEGKSVTSGVGKVKERFVEIMRSLYPDVFTNGDSITPEMIDEAFMNRRNGFYTMWAGGTPYECTDQVEQASAPLINEVMSHYHGTYKHGNPYGTLILDGGGCGLMNEVLREQLNHPNIKLADTIKRIQFANVKGAGKLRKLMVRREYI